MTSIRTWRIVALAFLLFLLLVVIWADLDRMPRLLHDLCDYPGGDKVGHFGLYGMFAFLGAQAWRRPLRLPWGAIPAGVLPAVLLATLEETSQLFFANRSAEWMDLGAGFLGIGVAILLVTIGPLRHRAAESESTRS